MSNGHIGIASEGQFQCVPTTYVTENKENYHFNLFSYDSLVKDMYYIPDMISRLFCSEIDYVS